MLAATCLAAVAAIPAGAVPVRTDFQPAPCSADASRALRYDARHGVLTAARDIAQGEVIAAPPISLLPAVRPGDRLTLVARVGTATVERQVTAAQPGRHGRCLFVRTGDGLLISAPFEAEGPQ